MSTWIVRSIALAMAFTLEACGDGGGSQVASTPPPPPAPPPTPPPPPIVPAAATSQQFAATGAVYVDLAVPQLDPAEQLQVRYIASTNSYEVQLPHGQTWSTLQYDPIDDFFGGSSCGCGLVLSYQDYQYSRLFVWNDGERLGQEAIGIPTPASGVPITGSATYNGQIQGFTSENGNGASRNIGGTFAMSFDFGGGSFSGSFSPILIADVTQYSLETVNFRNTVYSTGSATFSGNFDTDLVGLNGFSGLFTGPNGEELIGNFALPYRSPLNDQIYEAGGAFVGAK